MAGALNGFSNWFWQAFHHFMFIGRVIRNIGAGNVMDHLRGMRFGLGRSGCRCFDWTWWNSLIHSNLVVARAHYDGRFAYTYHGCIKRPNSIWNDLWRQRIDGHFCWLLVPSSAVPLLLYGVMVTKRLALSTALLDVRRSWLVVFGEAAGHQKKKQKEGKWLSEKPLILERNVTAPCL